MRLIHRYVTSVKLIHIKNYECEAHSHLSDYCEAHSQLRYECEAHSHLSYHCEAHSPLCYECEAHSHFKIMSVKLIHTSVTCTTVRLIHRYECEAHSHLSYYCEVHSQLRYESEAHSHLSYYSYVMGVKLIRILSQLSWTID